MSELPKMILIAHDAKKPEMAAWAQAHINILKRFELWATGTTGALLQEATGLKIKLLLSGPMGGDAQAGAMIATGQAQAVVFLWDALSPHPHDVDVRTVLRLAVLHNIPMACNTSTANALMKGLADG